MTSSDLDYKLRTGWICSFQFFIIEGSAMMDSVRQWEQMRPWSYEQKQRWNRAKAQKRREEMEERRRKREEEQRLLEEEDARFRKQQRQEAIIRAKDVFFHQSDRVRQFQSAMGLSGLKKGRQAQLKRKQEEKMVSEALDKEYFSMQERRRQKALEKDRQKALKQKQDLLDLQQCLIQQIHNKGLRKGKMEKKEEDKYEREREAFLLEQSLLQQKKKEQQIELSRALRKQMEEKEELLSRETLREKQEEKRQKLFLDSKDQQAKLQLRNREQRIRDRQMRTELVIQSMGKFQLRKQPLDEDLLISKAMRKEEAKALQQEREKEKMKAAMIDSIKEHTRASREEEERRRRQEKRDNAEVLAANKEADRKYLEEQNIKDQKKREYAKEVAKFRLLQAAEKRELEQRRKREDQMMEIINAELIKEEEERFQRYAERCIQSARAAGKCIYPLCKAAQRGVGGGLGPVIDGARSRYLDPEPRPMP